MRMAHLIAQHTQRRRQLAHPTPPPARLHCPPRPSRCLRRLPPARVHRSRRRRSVRPRRGGRRWPGAGSRWRRGARRGSSRRRRGHRRGTSVLPPATGTPGSDHGSVDQWKGLTDGCLIKQGRGLQQGPGWLRRGAGPPAAAIAPLLAAPSVARTPTVFIFVRNAATAPSHPLKQHHKQQVGRKR
jgi:hypothetical protein